MAPYRSLRELIDAVQRTPARLTYASGGTGSPAHIAVLRLAAIVGQFDAVHVPYKGSPESDLAAAAGDVDFHVGPVGAALPFLRSGRLRALAVTSRERLPTLPDTATGVESGVPEWVVEPWMGMALPQAAPDQLVDVVADALRRVSAQPEMLGQMQLLVGVPDFAPAAEFAAQIARELAIERAIVKRRGQIPFAEARRRRRLVLPFVAEFGLQGPHDFDDRRAAGESVRSRSSNQAGWTRSTGASKSSVASCPIARSAASIVGVAGNKASLLRAMRRAASNELTSMAGENPRRAGSNAPAASPPAATAAGDPFISVPTSGKDSTCATEGRSRSSGCAGRHASNNRRGFSISSAS